jgi:hypothetical protein
VRQAVQQCRSHLRVTKYAGPLPEGQVGRDHHGKVRIEEFKDAPFAFLQRLPKRCQVSSRR